MKCYFWQFNNKHCWLLIVEPLVEYFRECFSWDFLTWIIWQEWPWPQLIPAILHTGTGCKLQLVTLQMTPVLKLLMREMYLPVYTIISSAVCAWLFPFRFTELSTLLRFDFNQIGCSHYLINSSKLMFGIVHKLNSIYVL